MLTLRRSDVVVRLQADDGNARHGIVAAGIGQAEEPELVAVGQRLRIAHTTHDGGVVLVERQTGYRVVIGGTHGADALVEGPVSHQFLLVAAQHVVVVLQHGGLRQRFRPEAYLVDVALHGLAVVLQRTDGHASRSRCPGDVGTVQHFLGSHAADAVFAQQVNPALTLVVGEGDAGKLIGLDAQRRRLLLTPGSHLQGIAVVGVVAQTDAQLSVDVEQTVATLSGVRIGVHLHAEAVETEVVLHLVLRDIPVNTAAITEAERAELL